MVPNQPQGDNQNMQQNIQEAQRLLKKVKNYIIQRNTKKLSNVMIKLFQLILNLILPDITRVMLKLSVYIAQSVVDNNLKKYQEAIECYDKALLINPKNDQIWNNKGHALRNLNKYQEAIECYDKALLINPQNDQALNNKVKQFMNQFRLCITLFKEQYEAIECYNKAIIINPQYDTAWSSKGWALHQLKKFKDAIQCYDQALSICIKPTRLRLKADILFEQGNKNEAKQFYLAALEKGSNEKDYIQRQLSQL